MRFSTIFTLSLSIFTPLVASHGRIVNITTQTGTIYQGYDPELSLHNDVPHPPLVAWSADNLGNIYVTPSSFNSSNITCHKAAQPGALHVNISAGHTLRFQWNEWPTSHKGPVLTYLAACNQSCADADKDALRWVKIDEQGWLNSTGWAALGGTWASDVLIANRFAWLVRIPESLAPGAYVLRHEIIALHVADEKDGAQSYPQCVNIMVDGAGVATSGLKSIKGGVDARTMYRAGDPGISINIHRNISGYQIPGPALWEGASVMKQPNEVKMGRKLGKAA